MICKLPAMLRGQSLFSSFSVIAVFLLCLEAGRACVPGMVQYTTLAPVSVFVPIGGSATLTGLVRCKTDSDDFTPTSTLTMGGAVQFDVRLVDEDSVADDVLDRASFQISFPRQISVPPGFARDVHKSLRWKVECPANQMLIVGTESSGEGAPGCSDPADGALEIDHGSTQENTNHYPGNLFGNPGAANTVPICCVPADDERVSQTSNTRSALVNGSRALQAVCEERSSQNLRSGEKRQEDGAEPICGDSAFVVTTLEMAQQYLGLGGSQARIRFTSISAIQGREHIPFGFPNLNEFGRDSQDLEVQVTEVLEEPRDGQIRQQSSASISIDAADPFIPVSGSLQPDGTFMATGSGTFAGFPNVTVDFQGTYHAEYLRGVYRFGAAGELPGGNPLTLEIEAENQQWRDFLAGFAGDLRAAAEALAQLNSQAPFGGVDFSQSTLTLASNLADAEATLRFGESEGPENAMTALRPPGDRKTQVFTSASAFAAIEQELEALADAVAGSSLINRVQLEAAVRAAVEQFALSAEERERMIALSMMAPSSDLVDALIGWLQGTGRGGLALTSIADTLLGGEFATVSAADFQGPNVAPDSIVSGFGENLAPDIEVATSVPLPTTLSGVSIRITDSEGAERLAGLFFSSSGQFNFHVNAETALGPAVLTVFSGDQVIASGRIVVRRVVPSIFTANSSGQGVAAAVVQRVAADGSVSFQNVFSGEAVGSFEPAPIDLGPEGDRVFLLLFGTGIRGGETVTARAGGQEAPVLGFAESAEFVGLDQVNIELLRALAGRGAVDVEISVDGLAANTVTIAVQ